MNQEYHIPVLLNECIEALNIKPDGIYVDVTFGGGGHSTEILKHLTTGKLVGFDQDDDAAENVAKLGLDKDERFIFVNHNFKFIRNFLRYHKIDAVDGILADLGVSWHQFDVADRGFSFRYTGKLDMRMNRESDFSAIELLNEYPVEKLTSIFRNYGELPNAWNIARGIDDFRQLEKIETNEQFMAAIERTIPKKNDFKFLAKVFQALRIEINQEIEVLKSFLESVPDLLKPEGRLAVISYHSLEDRLAKNFIAKGIFEGEAEQDIFGNISKPLVAVTRKPIVPCEEEIERNNKARSAKLRVAEKEAK